MNGSMWEMEGMAGEFRKEPGLWKEGVVQCAVGDIWNLRASFIQLIFE